MKPTFLTFALLLLPALCGAQVSVSSYEFSSVTIDAPADPDTGYALQGILGQTFATTDAPTDSDQIQVFAGFGETYVPYAYLAQITLDSYIGNADPGIPYGLLTNIPFTAETLSTDNSAGGVLPTATFFADSTGKVKVLSSLNPAFAQSLSIKGPLWLRQNITLTFPADPANGYPAASFTLLGGDANGDNTVDLGDFGVLVNAYETAYDPNDPGNGYDPTADFNQDGRVDISDFGILVNNYGSVGVL